MHTQRRYGTCPQGMSKREREREREREEEEEEEEEEREKIAHTKHI